MKKSFIGYLTTIVVITLITACQKPAEQKPTAGIKGTRQLLTADFQQSQTIRYKFISSRDIEVVMENDSRPNQSKSSKYYEKMEIIMAYTPVEVDPYAFTTIEAKCESVTVKRNSVTGRSADAAEKFAGKTFKLRVAPTGKIEDYGELQTLLKKVAEEAFRKNSQHGRIKEPDMVCDFLATQWFLWDAVSSVEKPAQGIAVGDTWKSQMSIPTPMVMHKARDVVYKLQEIQQSDKGKLALITSSYSLSKSPPSGWSIPYTGSFQQSGPLGFYVNYKILDLHGTGQEIFNISAGRTEQYQQDYQMNLTASLMLPLGIKPKINISQKLSMQLLED